MSNILVVDDDQDTRRLVTHYLEKAGYFVMTAENGRDAFEKDLEAVPDLLILDNVMPEMFGYELVKKLKNSDATAYIRIIMLSSLDHPTEIANGLIAGADDYITKPFIPKILLARVRAQLRTKLLINQLLKKRKP